MSCLPRIPPTRRPVHRYIKSARTVTTAVSQVASDAVNMRNPPLRKGGSRESRGSLTEDLIGFAAPSLLRRAHLLLAAVLRLALLGAAGLMVLDVALDMRLAVG